MPGVLFIDEVGPSLLMSQGLRKPPVFHQVVQFSRESPQAARRLTDPRGSFGVGGGGGAVCSAGRPALIEAAPQP